jgi:hypothetical protein
MAESLGQSRFSEDTDFQGTRLVFRAQRPWLAYALMSLLLLPWAFGMIVFSAVFFDQELELAPRIIIICLGLLWTAAGALILFFWLRITAGTEFVEIDGEDLRHFRGLGILSQDRYYSLKEVQRLRLYDDAKDAVSRLLNPWFWEGLPGLQMDYGAKTVNLVFGLEEADAHAIYRLLLKKHPKLGRET